MRKYLVDCGDFNIILDSLEVGCNTIDQSDTYLNGYRQALEDLRYASSLGVLAVEQHLQNWDGFTAITCNDHGYMNALFDFQEEINALIEERKE